jgi:preprotein translocase subunit SecA
MARRLQMQHATPQSVISSDAEPEAAPAPAPGAGRMAPSGPEALPQRPAMAPQDPVVREGRKVGRNEPCPCGSGKKYKHCHGQLVREA